MEKAAERPKATYADGKGRMGEEKLTRGSLVIWDREGDMWRQRVLEARGVVAHPRAWICTQVGGGETGTLQKLLKERPGNDNL